MIPKRRKSINAIVIFLLFTLAQLYLQVGLANSESATGTAALPGQQAITGKLTTKSDQPILVNGNNLSSGGTVLTGAILETPDLIGATIDLGPLGSLDIAPNTKLKLEYDENGNVKVTIIVGCVILRTKKNTQGEVATEQGTAAKNDKKTGGILDVCFPPGATGPIVGQGAAAAGGAGAGGGGAAGGGLFSLSDAIWAGIFAAEVGLPLTLNNEGGNPSPGAPGV